MEEMTIKEFAAILKRGLKLLIIIPLAVTILTGIYFYYYTENQYTAEAKLYVLINYEDALGSMRYDVYTSTSFVGDYQQLIKTHEVLSAAAEKLGVENLDEKNIDVSSHENTRVINLSVTGSDPLFCMNAANTISEVFIEHLESITHTESVSIASKALMPQIPSSPNRLRNTAIAFIVSFLFVAGMLIMIANMNTTIRTSDDVENYLNIPVLAHITNYKKQVAKFMSQKGNHKPLYYSVSRDTQEGIKALSMNLQFVPGSSDVKTLAITSATPGEGKSTIAVMLATALAGEGKRVLLCDMDFRNPSLGKYLGVRNRMDIVDVLKGSAKIDKVITESSVKGLFMVDSFNKRVLLSNVIHSPQFKELISEISDRFDYIIYDTPPIGLYVDSAMLANIADRTLLVIASGRVERLLGKEIVDQLQKANASIIGVALNLMNERRGRYEHLYRHYKKYRCDEYNSEIPDRLHA